MEVTREHVYSKLDLHKYIIDCLKSTGSNKERYILEPIYNNKKIVCMKYKNNLGILKMKVLYEGKGKIAFVYGDFDEQNSLTNGIIEHFEKGRKISVEERKLVESEEYMKGSICVKNVSGELITMTEGKFDSSNNFLLEGMAKDYFDGTTFVNHLKKDGDNYIGTIIEKDEDGNIITKYQGLQNDEIVLKGKKIFYNDGKEDYVREYDLVKEGEYYRGIQCDIESDGKLICKSEGLHAWTYFLGQKQLNIIDGKVVESCFGCERHLLENEDGYFGEIIYYKDNIECFKEEGQFETIYSKDDCEFEHNVFLTNGKKYVNGVEMKK